MDVAELRAKIRDIKDFPTEGILFKDITTLLKDGPAFRYVIDVLAGRYQKQRVDIVVAVESRGFIFGGALGHELSAGLVPVRKLGKLPGMTIEVEYELEYGRDALAVHEDAIKPGQRGLAVDDLLATGGTMAATLRLIEQLGAAGQAGGAGIRPGAQRGRSTAPRRRLRGAARRQRPLRRRCRLRLGHREESVPAGDRPLRATAPAGAPPAELVPFQLTSPGTSSPA